VHIYRSYRKIKTGTAFLDHSKGSSAQHIAKTRKFVCRLPIPTSSIPIRASTSVFCHKRTWLCKFSQLPVTRVPTLVKIGEKLRPL